MRSKYIKPIVSFILSVFFYLLLFPLLIFIRDVVGIEASELIYLVVWAISYLVVYGLAAFLVEFGVTLMNNKLMAVRKDISGRDIAAEELHEDESGLISLLPKE